MCAYHPRIEADGVTNLTTTRTCNSELWFVNNKKLEEDILARLAKCLKRHEVELYAFALEGSHKHELPVFTKGRRAAFFRDFNSDVVCAVKRHCPHYSGCRKLWERRYSNEFVPDDKSVENEFFYIALQPVQDGLVERVGDYPGYNFFNDAISGRERAFKLLLRYSQSTCELRLHLSAIN